LASLRTPNPSVVDLETVAQSASRTTKGDAAL